MTALMDIKTAIDRKRAERKACPLIGRQRNLVVEVGDSAAMSLIAENPFRCVPSSIEDVPVVRTDEFRGWAVIER